MTHRISVVIPLYNHERYIEQAIASVLGQTLPASEIIVVDDGSTDGSARVAERLARQHPVIAFSSQQNRGAHAGINAGLQVATGDLLTILNSDDVFHPTRFAELVGAFDARPATEAVATALAFIDGSGGAISNPWYQQARRYYDDCGDMGLALVNGNFLMTTSNLMFRRSLVEAIGRFSPLRYAHDLDFFMRVAARGEALQLLDRPLLSYRQHATNTINEDHLKVKVEWAAVTAFHLYRLWEGDGPAPMDWARATRFLDVLDRHGLTRPVQLLVAYFRQHPTETLETSPFHLDAPFRAFMVGVVR